MNTKDFTWVEKRFGTRFANILKKLGGLSKDGTDGSIEYKDEQGNVSKLVTDSNFSSLLAKNGLIEVKWQELKDKRDNGELIPGSLYRITDYQCTTTQENTRSAGHQFDIVLLALSANKLAEEGWAMEHPTDVYDIICDDNVTLKCYIYQYDAGNEEVAFNVVRVDNFLGLQGLAYDELTINEELHTAIAEGYLSTDFNDENLPYNYFQNSNLSAWKVWYCLDNDKSRFAWADDSVDGDYIKNGGVVYIRKQENDVANYFAWYDDDGAEALFTQNALPSIGDPLYYDDNGEITLMEDEKITAISGTGRGVIYRLIDEWENDVPWDFKNIMFTLNNETTYSLSVADQDPDYEYDATLAGETLGVIVQTTHGESKQGRTPKSIYPISRVPLQQCIIYCDEDVPLDSYLFTNDGHANIIYGLEIYNPNT